MNNRIGHALALLWFLILIPIWGMTIVLNSCYFPAIIMTLVVIGVSYFFWTVDDE